MTATAFDTLKAAKALEDAGFDETQAQAIVVTVGGAVREHGGVLASSIATIADTMATKEYVATIAENMATKEYVATIAGNVATIAENMATKEYVATITENMATKEYVTAAIAELRAEIAVEFKTLYRHLWVMGTSIVGVTVVLVKLLP